jgi:hypothetical protein
MRIRLFGAVIALVGCAALASAQQPIPVAPPVAPPGMTHVPQVPPPSALPAYPAAPPVQYANPACGTPAPACDPCKDGKDGQRSSLFGKLFIGKGTASPVTCGCLAAERTFLFGGCKQFFTPGKTCGGCALEYGPGGVLGNCDNCRHVTSFLNR